MPIEMSIFDDLEARGPLVDHVDPEDVLGLYARSRYPDEYVQIQASEDLQRAERGEGTPEHRYWLVWHIAALMELERRGLTCPS